MHSRSCKQANDITLIENDVVITGKKELAELFNNYFVYIVDDVQDIKEHDFGNEFSAHPSIPAIAEENRRTPYIILILNTPIRPRLKNYYQTSTHARPAATTP